MKTSLIITTYNWPEALDLVLISVLRQSVLPDEIIIADDGSDEKTTNLITRYSNEFNTPIIHSWQKDKGFRVSRSRNKAIAQSSYEYIICIDGDLILHEDFIKDHKKNARENCYLQGSRVFLKKKYSERVIQNKDFRKPSFFAIHIKNRLNSIRLPFLTKIFQFLPNQNIKRIRACNFSMYKKDLIQVNGFNEDFASYGQEDSEFVQRLYFSGVLRRDLKFSALQFHIYHKQGSSAGNNFALLNKTIEKHSTWCDNGIDKHLYNNA